MIEELKYDQKGLIPAVIQEDGSQKVLMVAYMNKEALAKTLATGNAWFYSRSRGALWMKGETSGHIQQVKQILYDCDGDCLLLKVEQTGAACHTGHDTCFYRDIKGREQSAPVFDPQEVYGKKQSPDTEENREDRYLSILQELYAVIQSRKEHLPPESYTTYLFTSGLDKILKKVGEESAEVLIAAKNTSSEDLVYETADLIYHLLVLLVEKDIALTQVMAELAARR